MRLALVFLVGCGTEFKKEAQCSKAITMICDHQLECGLIADHSTCVQELDDDTRCNLDKDLAAFDPCLDSVEASSCVVGIPGQCLNVLCPAEGPCEGTVDTDFCDDPKVPEDAPEVSSVSESGDSVMCYVPPGPRGGTCEVLEGSEMNDRAYSGGNRAVECPVEVGILVTDGTCPTDRVLGTCKNTDTGDEVIYYKCNIGDGKDGGGNGAQGHCDSRNPEVTGNEERFWVWTEEGATPATE